ncbi:DUF6338 family protein [Amycolatopsis sp. NPDC005003]
MIPQTLGALAGFLALVAPGIVFELRRERRRGRHQETAFREASRVALGSLVFTLASVLLMTAVQQAGARLFVRPADWLTRGEAYAREHLTLIVVSVAVELAIACGLAWGFEALFAHRRGEAATVQQRSAWAQALRADRPAGTRAWAHAQLENGTSFYGYVRSYTPSGPLAERELVLEGEALTCEKDDETKVIGEDWRRVVIPGAKITYLRVTYLDAKTGETLPTPHAK